MFRSFIACAAVIGILAGAPAFAQQATAKTNPRLNALSRKVTIMQSTLDPATGATTAQQTWEWLDLGTYYQAIPLINFQPVVPVWVFEKSKPSGELIEISEMNAQGGLDRYIRLYNGMIVLTYYEYTLKYFYDIKGLSIALQVLQEQNKTSPTPKTGALMQITSIAKDGSKNTFYISGLDNISKLKTYLINIPEMTYKQRQQDAPQNYNRPNSFIIENISPSSNDLPLTISLNNNTIMTSRATPWTKIFYDKMNMGKMAIEQKRLIEEYRAKGITAPPRGY